MNAHERGPNGHLSKEKGLELLSTSAPRGRERFFHRVLDAVAIGAFISFALAGTFLATGLGLPLGPEISSKLVENSFPTVAVSAAILLGYRSIRGNFGVLR